MDMMDVLKTAASEAIDRATCELAEVSSAIWNNPELKFEEHFAHKTLTDFLEKHKFLVERNYVLETGFRLIYGAAKTVSDKTLPNVAVLCEYDALPEIGHACGHNLIAEVGVGAALGIKAALDAAKHAGKDIGTLTVLGTPGEESGYGKNYMIDAGAFDSLDAALMAHPTNRNQIRAITMAIAACEVTYEGKASHAAAFPWEGVNALDAAVMAYSSISVLRQQMKPTWRVHGVISSGGAKPNIIPERTTMEYQIRALSMRDLFKLKEKLSACFQSAADATGCQVTVTWHDKMYENMISNNTLVNLFGTNGEALNFKSDGESYVTGGGTDMGNVSHVVPSIHPFFRIGDAATHSRPFADVAGDPNIQPQAIMMAKALATTVIDIYCQPHLVDTMQSELKSDLDCE